MVRYFVSLKKKHVRQVSSTSLYLYLFDACKFTYFSFEFACDNMLYRQYIFITFSNLSGKIHMQRFGKSYHMSWLELGLDKKFEWEDARNYCRRFCMDSITFDSPREYRFFKNLIKKGTNSVHLIFMKYLLRNIWYVL